MILALLLTVCNWFEKPLPPQRITATASFTSGATTISVTSGDGLKVKNGAVLYDEETGEIMWATADGTSTQIQVDRGQGTSASASNGSADHLLIIGSAHPEGADTPTAITYDPDELYNYAQIFRNAVSITGTAMNTRTRWSESGKALEEFQRETLEMHSIEMERAALHGARLEDTNGPHPERTTGGLQYYVTTNVVDPSGGNVSIDTFENALKDVFANGSTEKLLLAGNAQILTLNKLCRAHYTVNTKPEDGTYGIKMVRYVTPFGDLVIKQHPLLSSNSAFADWGFVVDTKNVKYRYLQNRDTQWKNNVQNPGADGVASEFITECGFEIKHQSTHAIWKNFTNAV
jgi:hypothetical protein